ncbi:hypothetical protein HGRIS_003822 [Hohenbuehelia grisea]|uniref:Uncharacterized protein n=1 Tax=Hohenbuehelia grisea TaxID=104357 RepID=A0ABR3JGM7_9AGAR
MTFGSAGNPPNGIRPSGSSDSTDGLVNERASYFGDLPLFHDAQAAEAQQKPDGKFARHFQGWEYIVGSWLNVLLFLLPVAWIVGFTETQIKGLVFCCCILAIIPLVRLHDLSTRELSLRLGGSKAGLINGSMSNLYVF